LELGKKTRTLSGQEIFQDKKWSFEANGTIRLQIRVNLQKLESRDNIENRKEGLGRTIRKLVDFLE